MKNFASSIAFASLVTASLVACTEVKDDQPQQTEDEQPADEQPMLPADSPLDGCVAANACGSEQACVASGAQHTCLPKSCAGVLQGDATARDGEYTLYIDGDPTKPWTAYCKDMQSSPKEYLSLVSIGPDANFAQYTAGGASPGTNVRTRYLRLRIDPVTLQVDIGDQAFAISSGSLQHSYNESVTSMPFGVAMGCGALGLANIDLTGTPFVVADPFALGGNGTTGDATKSPNDRVVTVTGEGYCGWNGPEGAPFNPFNAPSSFALDLVYQQ